MKLLYNIVLIAALSATFGNCDGKTDSSNSEIMALLFAANLTTQGITFNAVVGDSEATCGVEISGHGDAASSSVSIMHVAGVMPIGLKDLRFYVSEFELVDQNDNVIPLNVSDDGLWQYSGVTLLDFENGQGSCSGTAETNNIVKTLIENKTYKTIRFTLGVPESLNHINYATAPSPLNISGLTWGWTMGYRFFVGEFLSADPSASGNSAVLHIGSTGCTEPTTGNYTCTESNRARIELSPAAGFNPSVQKIQFDLKTAVVGWDISAGSVSCHSMGAMDSNCPLVYPNFGLDYSTGNAGSTEQSVFSVVSK